MDNYKKLIPGFSCKNGQGIICDRGVDYYTDDILTLCRYYSDNGADEIFIYDASENDEDHERTIGIIKEIARTVGQPADRRRSGTSPGRRKKNTSTPAQKPRSLT